jgi:hypothetical protein
MSFKMDRSRKAGWIWSRFSEVTIGLNRKGEEREREEKVLQRFQLPGFEVRISISALPIFRIPNASIVFDGC